MNKYIDADRLKAEIESIALCPQTSADYNDGRDDVKAMVLDLVESLHQEQPEIELENYISNKLRELGADLINHKPYSFNRGLNVGKTNAYNDILDRLNVRKEE